MELIHEKYAILTAVAPQSVAASGDAAGSAIDLQGRHSFCVAALLGTVAAAKSVTVTLHTSNDKEDASPAKLAEAVFTPAEAVTDHVVELSGLVRPAMGRYLTVKIANGGSAAVLASAAAVLDCGFYPEDTGATVAVVGGVTTSNAS